MAELELPKKQLTKTADSTLRVGMIIGLAMGIDPQVLEEVMKDPEFRYVRETKAVLKLREEVFT